ncbi:MAG: ATP-binding protein [Candidatus Aenigmarchaeota archaeon]|nr:ATP-binding protein [Candidatus Aenigmarchaeota archaeon]
MAIRDSEERLISKEIKKLVPILGRDNAVRLAKAYLLADEDTRLRIFELVDAMKAAVMAKHDMRDALLLEPPPQKIAGEGDIEMGNVVYGNVPVYPFKLAQQKLLTHIGIFGSSGYGKTNLAYRLIEQLVGKNIPVLVFDFSKRNYRDLLSTPIGDKVELYTVGRDVRPFAFNPLKPPEGIQLSQWMKEFAAIFDHAYWLLGGGRHIIMKALEAVHEKKSQPVISDLRGWVNDTKSSNMSSRERNWLSTAIRPLDSLCFKEIGAVFSSPKGMEPSELLIPGKVSILELDSLDTNDKTFFIEITLQWLRDWLLVSQDRERLKGVIILEEAHHVLNREKSRQQGSETVMDVVFREIRELGMGVMYIDQHPSLVSYPALGNTSTQIYMNLGLDTKHSSDIQDASSMLGIDYEEEGRHLRKLPVGQGIAMCRQLGFPDPFVISFPKVNIRKGYVTDGMIREKLKTVTEVSKEVQEVFAIEDKGWKIIEQLGSGNGAFTSQLYSSLKLSGKTFARKAEPLLKDRVIACYPAKTGKNRLIVYYLTGKGYRLYEKTYRPEHAEEAFDYDNVLHGLHLLGWHASMVGANSLKLSKKGEEAVIKAAVINTTDREKVASLLKTHTHFVCSSERAFNVLLQEAAKWCSESVASRNIMVKKANEPADFQVYEVGG